MNERIRTILALSGVAILAATVAFLVATIPVEQVLGSRVRLPIFHGASTWVSLMTFTVAGVLGAVYLGLRRSGVYAWEAGLRWVSIALWAINTGLGLFAALNTWDFTGSASNPVQVAMEDPRLTAQFLLLIGAGVLTIVQLVFDNRLYKAAADLVFAGAMWALLAPVFIDPAKKALHPDSPVLNSGWEIKLPFFAIVAAVLGIALLLAWMVASRTPGEGETRAAGAAENAA